MHRWEPPRAREIASSSAKRQDMFVWAVHSNLSSWRLHRNEVPLRRRRDSPEEMLCGAGPHRSMATRGASSGRCDVMFCVVGLWLVVNLIVLEKYDCCRPLRKSAGCRAASPIALLVIGIKWTALGCSLHNEAAFQDRVR